MVKHIRDVENSNVSSESSLENSNEVVSLGDFNPFDFNPFKGVSPFDREVEKNRRERE